jgi:hypothetical protein
MPTALSSPISRTRCSTFSLKKSADRKDRRHDKEEAEVYKVLPEIRGATGRIETLRANILNKQPERIGSIRCLSRRETSSIETEGTRRIDVTAPYRELHSF